MRSDENVAKVREMMQQRLEEARHPLLRLIYQSKRDALGAVCNEGKDPRQADQNLEDALAQMDGLDFASFVKVQSARNAFVWVLEERDSI